MTRVSRGARRFRIALPILALLTLHVTVALAQSPPVPQPGEATRLRPPRGEWQTGTVVAADTGSVRMIRTGTSDTVAYAVGPDDRWEVARGSDAHTVRGLVFGSVLGAGVGALALRILAQDSGSAYGTADLAIGAAIGAGVGAGVGALIGSRSRTQRWVPVVRPGARMGAGVSVAF